MEATRTSDGAGEPAAPHSPEAPVPDPAAVWPLLRATVSPVVVGLARPAAYGVERVPLSGGVVIAANHLSAIDHPLLAALCPRPVHFLSKEELLGAPALGPLLAALGTIPVRRGKPDRTALRAAAGVARSGRAVAVHLEGTRQRFGHPGPMRPGGILVALTAGVPVVPCGLDTFGWTPRNRRSCALVWGEPIRLDASAASARRARAALELVEAEIVRLWRQAAEAVTAGLPPELPDGTPRVTLRPPRWHPGSAPNGAPRAIRRRSRG